MAGYVGGYVYEMYCPGISESIQCNPFISTFAVAVGSIMSVILMIIVYFAFTAIIYHAYEWMKDIKK